MAAKSSIAIRRNAAIARIEQSISVLSGGGFTLPTQGRDPDLVYALQLETIADWIETHVSEVVPPVVLAEAKAPAKKAKRVS